VTAYYLLFLFICSEYLYTANKKITGQAPSQYHTNQLYQNKSQLKKRFFKVTYQFVQLLNHEIQENTKLL